ncbi:Uncharacterised protein [Burkholderia pseudomallei]|nr:Uncharacterised protein [Burkholderia pseudomallei]
MMQRLHDRQRGLARNTARAQQRRVVRPRQRRVRRDRHRPPPAESRLHARVAPLDESRHERGRRIVIRIGIPRLAGDEAIERVGARRAVERGQRRERRRRRVLRTVQHAVDAPVTRADPLRERRAVSRGVAFDELEARAAGAIPVEAGEPGRIDRVRVGQHHGRAFHGREVAGKARAERAVRAGDPVHAARAQRVRVEQPARDGRVGEAAHAARAAGVVADVGGAAMPLALDDVRHGARVGVGQPRDRHERPPRAPGVRRAVEPRAQRVVVELAPFVGEHEQIARRAGVQRRVEIPQRRPARRVRRVGRQPERVDADAAQRVRKTRRCVEHRHPRRGATPLVPLVQLVQLVPVALAVALRGAPFGGAVRVRPAAAARRLRARAEFAHRHADGAVGVDQIDVVAGKRRIAAGEANVDPRVAARPASHDEFLHEERQTAAVRARLQDQAVGDLERGVHHARMQHERIGVRDGLRQREPREHLALALMQRRDAPERRPVMAAAAVEERVEPLRPDLARAAREERRDIDARGGGRGRAGREANRPLAVRAARAGVAARGHVEPHRAHAGGRLGGPLGLGTLGGLQAQLDLARPVDDDGRHPDHVVQAQRAVAVRPDGRHARHLEIRDAGQDPLAADQVIGQEEFLAGIRRGEPPARPVRAVVVNERMQPRRGRLDARAARRRRGGAAARDALATLRRERIGGQTHTHRRARAVKPAPIDVHTVRPERRDLRDLALLAPRGDQPVRGRIAGIAGIVEQRRERRIAPARAGETRGRVRLAAQETRERGGERVVAVGDERDALAHRLAAHLQRERETVEVRQRAGFLLEEREQLARLRAHALFGARRQRDHARRAGGRRAHSGGRLVALERLEDQMRVGAADAERAERRAARRPRLARGPARQSVDDVERRVREIDLAVRLLVVDRRRDLAVPQAQRDLDAPRQPGDGIQVADVRLHRADRAESGARGMAAIRVGERRHLHRIAELRAGAVRLDVADRLGMDAGRIEHLADHVGLAADTRRVEADLVRAVVVHGDAAQQRVDRVAVVDRVARALDEQHGDAFAGGEPVGVFVEGPAAAVARQVEPRLVHVADVRIRQHRRRADERAAAFPLQQRLRRDGKRHEPGRAVRMDEEAGPRQAEFVRDARRNRAALREQPRLILVGRVDRAGRAQHRLVVAVRRRHVYAGVGDPLARAAGVLDRLPRVLQQQTELRVHQLRILRRQPEEVPVEQVLAFDRLLHRHVVPVADQRVRHAGRAQFVFRIEPRARFPVAQIAPERAMVLRAGKLARDADDRDRVVERRGQSRRGPGRPRLRGAGCARVGAGRAGVRAVRALGRARVAAQPRAQMGGQRGDRRIAEERAGAEPREAELGADARGDQRHRQRIAAHLEKAVRAIDVVDLQHLAADREQAGLDIGGGRRARRRGAALARRRDAQPDAAARERLAVQLAVVRHRQRVDRQEQRGNHVVRQRAGQMAAQLGGQRRRVVRAAVPGGVAAHVVGDELIAARVPPRDHRGRPDRRMPREIPLDVVHFDAMAANLHLEIHAPEMLDFAVLAPAREVAGAVMALARLAVHVGQRVDEPRRRFVGPVQVARGEPVARDAQLARHADRHRIAVRIDDPDSRVVDRRADRGRPLRRHRRDHRPDRRLRRAVQVPDFAAVLEQPGLDGVRQRVAAAQHAHAPRVAPAGMQQHLPRGRRRLHHRRARRVDQPAQPAAVARRRAVADHAVRALHERQEQLEGRDIETVRGDGEQRVARVQARAARHRREEVGQRAMRDHHALRRARAARRVDHVGEIGRPRGVRAARRGLPRGGDRGRACAVGGVGVGVGGVVERDDGGRAVGRDAPRERVRARRERGAGQDRGRAAIAEHLRRPVVRIVGIERHVCRARLQHREQADDERRRAVEPHRDEVARADAARAQALRERVAVGLQSRIVERAAAAGHRDRVRGLLRARIDQVVHAPLARMVGARAAAKREQPFALGRGQHRAIGHPRGGRREHAVEQRQIVARHRLHGGRAIPRAVVLPVQRETRGAAGRRSFDHLEHELILARLTNLADRFDVVAEAQAREKILIHERDPVHRRAVLRALQAELANQRAERILHRHGVDELALHALEHRHDGGLAGQARAQRQHVDEEAERVAVTLRRPRVGRHADDDVGLAGIAMQQQLEHAEEERGGAEMVRLNERRDARRPRRVERHRMPRVARRALGRGRRRRGQLERGRQRVELPPPVRDAARALVAVEKRALLGDEIVVRGGRRARRGLDAVDERAVCVEQRADQQQQRLPVEHQVVHVQRHDRVRRAEPARGRRVARAPAGEIEQMHAAKRAVLERERLPRLLAQPREDRGLVGVGAERVGERRLDGLERRAGRLHPPRLAVDHADRRAQRRILPRDEAQRAAKRVRPQIAHGEAKRHVIGAAILVQRMQRPDPALPLRKRQTRAVARAPAKLARQIGGRQLPFAVGTNHITDDGVHLVFSIK